MKKSRNGFMNTLSYLCLAGVIALGLMTIVGTGGGGSGSNGTQYEAQEIIGPEGGVVEVTNSESPLYGVKVEIPEGALEEKATVSIYEEGDAPSLPLGFVGNNPIIKFDSDKSFSKELKITFPISYMPNNTEGIMGAFYYDAAAQEWRLVIGSDYNNDKMVVETGHLSMWTWGWIIFEEVGYEALEFALKKIIGDETWNSIKEVYDDEYYAELYDLANDIIDWAGCKTLENCRDYYEYQQSFSENVLAQFYGDPGDYCDDLPIYGDCNVTAEIFYKDLPTFVSSYILTKGVGYIAAGIGGSAFMLKAYSCFVGTIMLPCNICFAMHSGINPAFWIELMRYYMSSFVVELANQALKENGCVTCEVPILIPYVGNPLITGHTIVPHNVFKEGDTEYRMFFQEQNASGTYPADFDLDLMTSIDGLTWDATYKNVISSTQSGHTFNYYATEIKEGDTYKVWHSATSDWNIAGTKLYYSTSDDGVTYTGQGMVLDNEPYPEYDSRNIHHPYIVSDGSTYHLYYSAFPGYQSGPPDNANFHNTIAYATSTDGINWTKHGVVLDIGSEGSIDSENLSKPAVIFNGTQFEMFYSAYDGSDASVGYAISDDGLDWQKIGKVDSIDGSVVGAVKENGVYKVWYQKEPETDLYELCYATSS